MSSNNDFFGDPFDFNGDGMASDSEDFFAYECFLEDEAQNNADDYLGEDDEYLGDDDYLDEDDYDEDFDEDDYVIDDFCEEAYIPPHTATPAKPKPAKKSAKAQAKQKPAKKSAKAPNKAEPYSPPVINDPLAKKYGQLTLINYPERIEKIKRDITSSKTAGIGWTTVFVLIIIKSIIDFDSTGLPVILMLFAIGSTLIVLLWRLLAKSIKESRKEISVTEEVYQKLLKQAKAAQNKNSSRKSK